MQSLRSFRRHQRNYCCQPQRPGFREGEGRTRPLHGRRHEDKAAAVPVHHGVRRSGTYGKPVVRLNLGSEDDGAGFGLLAGDYLHPDAWGRTREQQRHNKGRPKAAVKLYKLNHVNDYLSLIGRTGRAMVFLPANL